MHNDRGFGLLEAIVSIAIIGSVAVTVFDLVIGATARRARSVDQVEQMLVAQRLLADDVALAAPAEGRYPRRGSDGRLWTITVAKSRESDHLKEVAVIPPGQARPLLMTLRLAATTR